MTSDAPERLWLWRDQPRGNLVVSTPSDPYPTGSPQYVRADLHQQALDRIEALEAKVKRLREALAQSLGSLKFAQAHIPAADAKIFQRRIDLVRDVLIQASAQEGEE